MAQNRSVVGKAITAFGRLSLSLGLLFSVVLACCRPSDVLPASAEDKLVVFAAASLREVFTGLSKAFARTHPGVTVQFNFAGTQELRTQLEQGAKADVFASADQRNMDAVARTGRVLAPRVFARNEPVIVVARESTTAVRALSDLPNASRIIVGTPDVPIGRYTLQILDRAGATLGTDFRARVEAKVVSRELNVRQVLAKVSLGEAQAGFVYRTDARAAQDGVSIVSIPPNINVLAEYPIAIVAGAPHLELARAWLELVFSNEGQRALQQAGFLTPYASVATP